eukprot:3002233-Lingulodinium_polyedra.AAC.1
MGKHPGPASEAAALGRLCCGRSSLRGAAHTQPAGHLGAARRGAVQARAGAHGGALGPRAAGWRHHGRALPRGLSPARGVSARDGARARGAGGRWPGGDPAGKPAGDRRGGGAALRASGGPALVAVFALEGALGALAAHLSAGLEQHKGRRLLHGSLLGGASWLVHRLESGPVGGPQ